jgi:hypothetical protein
MYTRNPELYLPAQYDEIRQFALRLDRVAGNLAIGDGDHTSIELDRRVTHLNGSLQTVRFYAQSYREFDDFRIVAAHAVPVSSLLHPSFMRDDSDDPEYSFDGSIAVYGASTDAGSDSEEEQDDVEGYLEIERELKVLRSPRNAEAYISSMVNVLDAAFNNLDSNNQLVDLVSERCNELEVAELERLFLRGEPVFDLNSLVDNQMVATRADLILGANVLKGAGLMHPLMKAYKGAPYEVDGCDLLVLCDTEGEMEVD